MRRHRPEKLYLFRDLKGVESTTIKFIESFWAKENVLHVQERLVCLLYGTMSMCKGLEHHAGGLQKHTGVWVLAGTITKIALVAYAGPATHRSRLCLGSS